MPIHLKGGIIFSLSAPNRPLHGDVRRARAAVYSAVTDVFRLPRIPQFFILKDKRANGPSLYHRRPNVLRRNSLRRSRPLEERELTLVTMSNESRI
jgi:hypothetical protein